MKKLSEQIDYVFNEYLNEFCKLYKFEDEPYWIAGDVGGLVDVSSYFFDFTTIKYCVDNGVGFDALMEWYDYTVRVAYLELPQPTLKNWMAGCPRSSDEALTKIEEARKILTDLIEEEKVNVHNGSHNQI